MSCSKKSLAALLGSINAPYILFRRPDPKKSNWHHVLIIVINKTTILLLTIITMIILVINYLSLAPKDWAGQSLEVISDSIREGVEPAWWDLITDQEIGIIIRRLGEAGVKPRSMTKDTLPIAHCESCKYCTLQCMFTDIACCMFNSESDHNKKG